MKKEEIIEKMIGYAFENFKKSNKGELISKNINFDIKDVKFELDYSMHEITGDKTAEDYLLTKRVRVLLKDMYCFEVTDLKNNTKTFYFYKEVLERIRKLLDLDSDFKSIMENSLINKNILIKDNGIKGSRIFDITNPDSVHNKNILYINEYSLSDVLSSLNLSNSDGIEFDEEFLKNKLKTQLNYDDLDEFIDSIFLLYETDVYVTSSYLLLVSENAIKSLFNIDTEKFSYSVLYKDSFLAMIDNICKGNYIANMRNVTNPIANIIIEKQGEL